MQVGTAGLRKEGMRCSFGMAPERESAPPP